VTGQTDVIMVEFCCGSRIQLLLHRNTNLNFRAIVTFRIFLLIFFFGHRRS